MESDIFGDNIDEHVLSEYEDYMGEVFKSDGDGKDIRKVPNEILENLNFDSMKYSTIPILGDVIDQILDAHRKDLELMTLVWLQSPCCL